MIHWHRPLLPQPPFPVEGCYGSALEPSLPQEPFQDCSSPAAYQDMYDGVAVGVPVVDMHLVAADGDKGRPAFVDTAAVAVGEILAAADEGSLAASVSPPSNAPPAAPPRCAPRSHGVDVPRGLRQQPSARLTPPPPPGP